MNKKHVYYFALFVFLLVAIMGATQVKNWSTDNYSDRAIYNEMLALVETGAKFGIVGNTHYPNGPGYVLVPFIKLGITDYETLRFIPYAFSIFSVAYLLLTLLALPLTNRSKITALALMLFPLMLPGFVYWQGALHEHSYAMSLCLLSIALALRPLSTNIRQLTALVLIGFISGWMGYDFLPVQGLVFALMALSYGVYLRAEPKPHSFGRAIGQSSALAIGMIAAIKTHLLQNTLYFGSAQMAWNDLIGSAAARAGADGIAQDMNPAYTGSLAASIESLGHKTDTVSSVSLFFHSFINDWSSVGWVTAFSAALCIALFFARNRLAALTWRKITVLTSFFVAAISTGIAWTVLMPKHAVIHMHFVPRHILVSIIAAIFILAMALDSASDQSKDRAVI